MRLIDADALERRMNERLRTLEAKNGPYDHYTCGYEDAIDEIEDVPTIEAEPVRHGRWEWIINGLCTAYLEPIEPYYAGWGCSVCGIDLLQYLQSHFPDIPSYLECACEEMPTLERCPNCGARMDGKIEMENK